MDEIKEIPLSDPDKFEQVFKSLIGPVRLRLFENYGDPGWVQDKSQEVFLRLWEKREEIETEQAEEFINDLVLKLLQEMEKKRKQIGELPVLDLEEAWEMFTEVALNEAPELPEFKIEGKKVKQSRRVVLLTLALLLVILSVAIFIPPKPEKFAAKRGEHRELKLDSVPGLELRLNAASAVLYSGQTILDDLNFKFVGEGYFDCKEGGPLRVSFSGGEVETDRGSFNLQVRNEGWELKCFRGPISLRDQLGKPLTSLNSGQCYRVRGEKGHKTTFDVDIPLWKDGKLVFEAATFDDVIAELERQYDLTIFFPARGFPVFTGTLDINLKEESLATFANTYDLSSQVEDEKTVRFSYPPN